MDDSIQRIKQANELQADKAQADARHHELVDASLQMQETILQAFKSLVNFLDNQVTKTELVNQLESIGTPDVAHVVTAVDELHETLKTHENTDLSEVTEVMRAVLAEAKQLPKSFPDIDIPQPIDNTKQLASLEKTVKAVEQAVKAQKLVAEPPIINLPETNVNVEAPDLKPLQDNLQDVVDAVKGIVIPEYKTDNKEVEKLLKKQNKILGEILDKPVGGGGGGGRATPYEDTNGVPAFVALTAAGKVPVDATVNVTGLAAYSDSGGTDRKGLVDADRHVQVDVLTQPALSSATDSVTEANSGSIKTAVELIDDPIKQGGTAVSTSTDKYMTAGIRNAAGNASPVQGRSTTADGVTTNASGNSMLTAADNYVFNGTTWDRMRGDTTNGLDVDVTRLPGTVETDLSSSKTSLDNIETYLDNRYGGGKTPVPFTVTASGDTTIHTPAAGKAIRLYSIKAIIDPDEITTPLIKVLIGTTEKIRGHAIGEWEILEGAANEVLKINLSAISSVSGTAFLKEFTP